MSIDFRRVDSYTLAYKIGAILLDEFVEHPGRPVYLRDEDRTRGHALVVMLAYLLVQALRRLWRDIDLTVQEGLDRLASLCLVEVIIAGRPSYNQVPTPRDDVRRLFEAVDVAIPTALPLAPARVATRQKLPQRRKAK